MLKRLLLAAFLTVSATFTQPQTSTVIAPDCSMSFSFTATSRYPATGFSNTTGCTDWILRYSNTGFSAVSVEVDSAPDSSGSVGTWAAFGGKIVDGNSSSASSGPGVNPNTATDWAYLRLQGSPAWVSVTLASKTGTGRVNGTLLGWKRTTSAGSGGSSPGTCGTTLVCNNQANTYSGGGLQDFGSDNLTTAGTVTIGATVSAQKGQLMSRAITASALYTSNQNAGGISMTSVTQGGYQFVAYNDQNTTPHVHVVRITQATGVLIDTDTGFVQGSNDEHLVPTIGIDKNGYLQLGYNMHTTALNYRTSTNPYDQTAWTATKSMLGGTPETSVSYLYFFQNATGELFATFRCNAIAGHIQQYLYSYNATSHVWSAAVGSSTAGLIIDYTGSGGTNSPYLNGRPLFDGLGRAWFSWETGNGSLLIVQNQYLMYWDGASFFSVSGAAKAIPATDSDTPDIATTIASTQNIFAVDLAGVAYVGYPKLDANSVLQIWVAETSSGALVAHQLTANVVSNTQGQYTTVSVVSVAPFVYVVYPDNISGERGIAAHQSGDHFASNRRFYVSPEWNPNWALVPDQNQLASGVVSFVFMGSNDVSYGGTYLSPTNAGNAPTNPDLGILYLETWLPTIDSGSTRGRPTSQYGIEVIGTHNIVIESEGGAGSVAGSIGTDANGANGITFSSPISKPFFFNFGLAFTNKALVNPNGLFGSSATETNTPYNGNPITGTASFSGPGGNWGWRGDTSHCANLDVFGSSAFSALKTCTDGTSTFQGANKQGTAISQLTELTTIAASATTATAIQVPAGVLVLGVSVRVTTAIPTAATFTVTGTTSSKVFDTAAVSTALSSTDPGTAAGVYYNATAETITLTPNLTPGTNAGRVRVTVHYISIVPPSN